MASKSPRMSVADQASAARYAGQAQAQYLEQFPGTINLTPEEDFSGNAAAQRESEQQRAVQDAARRLFAEQDRQDASRTQPLSSGYPGVSTQPVMRALGYDRYADQARDLLSQEAKRVQPFDISGFDSVKSVIDQAKKANVSLTSGQLAKLVDFGQMNTAADLIIARSRVGDMNAARNVIATMGKSNPVMAEILPDLIQQKLSDAAADPDIISNVVGWVGNTLGTILGPLMWANGQTQHAIRAGLLPSTTTLSLIPAFISPQFWQSAVNPDAWKATEPGAFNTSMLQALRDTGKWTDTQIEIAREIVGLAAQGDPEPIETLWKDPRYADDPVADRIFGNLIVGGALKPSDGGNMQELLAQVEAASYATVGAMWQQGSPVLGAVAQPGYQEWRSSSLAATTRNIDTFASQVVFDPTNLLLGAGKAFRAAKWALQKLAPGGESAVVILNQGTVATNTAKRFFTEFANDLNKLDDLGKQVDAASDAAMKTKLGGDYAALRNRMTRYFDEAPESLIEDFRLNVPKDADGKVTLRSIAEWWDAQNAAYITQIGGISDDMARLGATDAASRAVLLRTMDPGDELNAALETLDMGTAIQQAKLERAAQRLTDESIVARILSVGEKQTPQIPTMSLAALARKRITNAISVNFMPTKEVDRILAKNLSLDATPAQFAEDLSTNAVELGKDVRRFKSGMNNVETSDLAHIMRPSALIDNAGRAFSSLPDVRVVSIADASSTKTVYRLARTYFPKRVSEVIAEYWRAGTPGSRRKMLSGIVRSAGASRGLTIAPEQADAMVTKLTDGVIQASAGTKAGERYAVSVPMLPTERAALLGGRATRETKDSLPGFWDGEANLSLSADANGVEHALHLGQTADFAPIPSLADMEALRQELGWMAQKYGVAGRAIQGVTDYWSLLTLYGPRFSLRNAIEQNGLYLLSGRGGLISGRMGSQQIRRANPRLFLKTDRNGALVLKDGKPVVVRKTNLGMVANKAEKAALEMQQRNFPDWLTEFVFSATSKEDAVAAKIAAQHGDFEPFAELVAKAQVAHRLGLDTAKLSDSYQEALGFLARSDHGMAMYGQVAAARDYMFSGNQIALLHDSEMIDAAIPGVGWGKLKPPTQGARFKGWGNTKALQVQDREPIGGVTSWWEHLRKILDDTDNLGDGALGRTAVQHLDNPALAKAEVARILRDPELGKVYRDRFSAITDDISIDRFASNYVEDVFQHFTDANGRLNKKLWRSFFGPDGPSWWTEAEDGTQRFRMSLYDLKKVPTKSRPAAVFGRIADDGPWLPFPETDASLLTLHGFSDRMFGWMGRQNARISGEPIFLGNYFRIWDDWQPAREKLAQAMADGQGRAISEMDRKLSGQLISRQALDAAYNQTISFIDNPANRSNFAWKVRNASRYYRATEDFFRRLKRVAKNNPEVFYRAALVYQSLDDTGFVFTDDSGEKYFAYPSNGILQSALTSASSITGLKWMNFGEDNPFLITGRVLGITPGLDPNQQLPSIMGPAAIPLVAAFDLFPGLQRLRGLQALTLGEFGAPTGDLGSDIANALIPAFVARSARALDPDQRDASLAQSAVDAIAVMLSNNQLDHITVNGKDYPVGQYDVSLFQASDQYQQAQRIAYALWTTKLVLQNAGPAAPSVMSNTVSDVARRSGITGIKDVFYKFLTEADGDWAQAYSRFVALQSKDPEASMEKLLPFTVSATTDNQDAAHQVAALANVREYGTSLVKFLQSDRFSTWKKNGVWQAGMFFAPRADEEFDYTAWNMVKNQLGLRVPKDSDDMIREMLAAQGNYAAGVIRTRADLAIAGLDQADPMYAIKRGEEIKARDEALAGLKNVNTNWDSLTVLGPDQGSLEEAFTQMRRLLDLQRPSGLTRSEKMVDNAMKAWQEWQTKKQAIPGQSYAAKAVRAQIDQQMAADLAPMQADPAARMFIGAVLGPLSYNPADNAYLGEGG